MIDPTAPTEQLQADIAEAQTILAQRAMAAQSTEEANKAEAVLDLSKLDAALFELNTLLADNTVTGSIRTWKGAASSAELKSLADLMLTQTRQVKRIGRAVMRLGLLVTETTDVTVPAE